MTSHFHTLYPTVSVMQHAICFTESINYIAKYLFKVDIRKMWFVFFLIVFWM